MKKFLMLVLVACLGFFLNPNCEAETYFIADTHFGGTKTMKRSGRPFRDAEEMDETMINLWNDAVEDDDDGYILGDFASDWQTKEDVFNILEQLKGKKHLIIGNHDECWLNQCTDEELLRYFETLPQHMEIIYLENEKIALCHYPLFDFPGVVIHGHIHNFKNRESGWEIIRNKPSILNAGVDINGFKPVTLMELRTYNHFFKRPRRFF